MANTPNTATKRKLQSQARVQRAAKEVTRRFNSHFQSNKPVQQAVTAGRNQVQINGNYYPAEGVEGQGAAIAVVNVGTPAVAKYAPSNTRSVVGVAGSGLVGGGGGGGGGPVYVASDGIAIDGGNVISVKRDASGAIGLGGSAGIKVNVGDGIAIATNALTLNLATNPGLEYGTAGDAGKVRVKAYHGINRDANGIGIKLLSGMTAMVVDANGLAIADALAGNGLTIDGTTKVLAVGAGDGIDVNADDIAVDVTDIIDTMFGLEENANNIRVKRDTNSGLLFGGTGGLALGTPSTLSYSGSNHVTSTTHGHAITTSEDVGLSPQEVILRSNSGGILGLAGLNMRGNISFLGGNRSILASNTLTIAPTTDLILDPTGLVLLPVGQEMRSGTFNDFVAGIAGFRHWDKGGNVRQLTIGAIKADELYVRVFTADEARVNRGEEFWTRSYAYVDTEFTTPADEATVDVWFEEAPGLGSLKLFLPDNWILIRTIDIDTGITVTRTWYQVVDADGAGTNDYIQRQDATTTTMARQQWRLRRKSGGATGVVVKKGNVAVDFGKPFSVTTPLPGQGVVHLSALAQDGGPFVQIQTFESVIADVPQFKNRVRMGNLGGTIDYSSDTYGFATGNDLSMTPSTGFSGMAAEATNGMRLFNTDLRMYKSGILSVSLTQADGLRFLVDDSQLSNEPRYISWHDAVEPLGNIVSYIATFGAANRFTTLYTQALGTNNLAQITLQVGQQSPEQGASITVNSGSTEPSFISLSADATQVDNDLSIVGSVMIGSTTIAPLGQFEVYGASGNMTLTRAVDDPAAEPNITFRKNVTPTLLAQIRGLHGEGLRFTNGAASVEWARFDNGFEVSKAVTAAALGRDNVRLGVLSGTPRVILEDSASATLWEIDNFNGSLRLFTPAGVIGMQFLSGGSSGIGTSSPTSPNSRTLVFDISAAAISSSAVPGLVLRGGSAYSNPA